MAKKIDVYGELNSRTGDGVLADASQIWDSTQGKFQDEINQETANDGLVSVKVEQEFTDEEKAQGRENLGAASQEDVEEKLQQYAKKDGSYEQLISGAAMNLAGQTVEVNSEMYHPTGVEHASGVAEVRSIKGNTVAWNQKYNPNKTGGSIAGLTATWINDHFHISGTISANYAAFNSLVGGKMLDKTIAGHVYYFGGMRNSNDGQYITPLVGNDALYNNPPVWVNSGSYIAKLSEPLYGEYLYATNGSIVDIEYYPTLIDLTLIYGAGNEPSTPEQFEADYERWFGKPLTYEEYDEGSLRSVNMAAYKTVGFNQWDEEWELGSYDNSGNPSVATDRIRTKNYIPIFSNTAYYARTNQRYIGLHLYDINKNIISGANAGIGDGVVFTTPINAAYLRFSVVDTTTYNHDICINISNAERNGEYEPYEVHNYPMPVTAMKGKLNGEGASVVVFPDGMRSAGTIHDEIFISGGKTYGIRRVGSVDLGTLSWQYVYGDNSRMVAIVSGIKMVADYRTMGNMICSIYDVSTSDNIYIHSKDKTIAVHTVGSYIWVYDTAYSDAATFKSAMNGVMLYYELATPEIYEIDDFQLPQNVLVDSDGTEEVINATGKENDSVAPYIDMIYSINAVGALNNLPQGYISEKSMDNFLARLSSAMGGTWTKSWNSTTKEWEFSFAQSANTNSLTQNNEEA